MKFFSILYKLRQIFVLLFLIIFSYIVVEAQIKDSVELIEIEIIEFRSTDLAIPNQIIPTNLVSSITDVEDYLSLYSHAFIKNYGQGGFATISLDGLQPRHTQVFWNGIPVNSSTIGITDISAYPLNNDLAINILKSTDSYRFTGSQMGGAVIMENFYRSTSGMNITFNQGSYGKWGAGISGFKSFLETKLKLKLSSGFDKAKNDFKFNDYSQNPSEVKRQLNAGYDKWYIQPGFEWRINDENIWQFNAFYSQINRDLPASILSPNNNAHQADDVFRLTNHWKLNKNGWKNNLILGYAFDQFQYEEKSGGNLNTASAYQTHKLVLNETLSRRINNHTIKFGGNLISDFAKGNNIENLNLFQGGLFSIWEWKFWEEKIELSSTIRGEFHSNEKLNASGNISLSCQPIKNIPLQLAVSGHRNIRNPTINDLYFKPSGNEDLNQESAWQLNGEVSYYKPFKKVNDFNITFAPKLAGYSIWLKDMIIWIPTNKIYWQPINLTSVHSRGIKLSNSLNISNNSKDLNLYFSQYYNYSVSTNESNLTNEEVLFPNDLTIGKQLPYIPQHQLKLNTYLEFKGVFVNFNTQYTSERYITGSNSYFLQKYWIADIGTGYHYLTKNEAHSLTISMAINNLFANDYYQEIAHIPMPSRHYQITLKYGFEKK